MTNKKPHVLTDAFLILLTKVVKEINATESEYVVIDRTDLFRDDNDLKNLAIIENTLKDVFSKVSNRFLTGEEGAEMIKKKILQPHNDLVVRLTESRKFPELYALCTMCS